VFTATSGSAVSANARFRSLEIASTNALWLFEKEASLVNSFGMGPLIKNERKLVSIDSFKSKLINMYNKFSKF